MTKILSLAALVGLLVAASSTADARMGASAFAPGQSFRARGSVAGHPGASGYAPVLRIGGGFFAPRHGTRPQRWCSIAGWRLQARLREPVTGRIGPRRAGMHTESSPFSIQF
jgi:hypothetical protein